MHCCCSNACNYFVYRRMSFCLSESSKWCWKYVCIIIMTTYVSKILWMEIHQMVPVPSVMGVWNHLPVPMNGTEPSDWIRNLINIAGYFFHYSTYSAIPLETNWEKNWVSVEVQILSLSTILCKMSWAFIFKEHNIFFRCYFFENLPLRKNIN